MKIKNLSVIVILFAIFSCSKNDNATPVNPAVVVDPADLVVTNFMPLIVANKFRVVLDVLQLLCII